MEKGTISICFVQSLLDSVQAHGFDGEELLCQSGISSGLLELPHARVSSATYTVLVRLVVQLLDDEFFGQDSRRMKVGSFAMLGHAAIHCKTLNKAMRRALRFVSLCLDDLRAELVQGEGVVQIRLRPTDPAHPAPIFGQETLLVYLHRIACWLINRRIPVLAAQFHYPPPPHADEYRLLFSPDLSFQQPFTSLTIESRYFEMPVVRTESALKDFLRIVPENLWEQYKDSESLAARIRLILRDLPPAEWPGFEGIARDLGLSASTLRRRLEAVGQSYQVIKDRLRQDMAINFLSDSTLNVTDIADQLGFAEASAFHRAFKKWTGANPGEYRRRSTQEKATAS